MPALPLFTQLPYVCALCDRLIPAGDKACPGCRTLAVLPEAQSPAPVGLGDDDGPATSVAWPIQVPAPSAPRTDPGFSVAPAAASAARPVPAGAAPTRAAPSASVTTARPTAPMAAIGSSAPPSSVPTGLHVAQSNIPTARRPVAPERLPPAQRPVVPLGAGPVAPTRSGTAVTANRYALVLLGGPARGKRLVVSESEVYLGASQIKDDPCLSHQHAGFVVRAGRLYVHDRNSVSGVYVSIRGQEAIAAGSWFSAGQRCFHFIGRLEAPAGKPGAPVVYGAPVPASEPLFAVEEMLAGGRPGRAFASASNTLSIGSGERTDLCYPGDEGLGVIHCEFSPGVQSGLLRDLSGGLGTFVRLAPGVERRLYPGDRVRVGSQLLRVDQLADPAPGATAQQPGHSP